MLTTAGPAFSTSSVKSGNSRACAWAPSGSSSSSHRSSIFFIVTFLCCVLRSVTEKFGCAPAAAAVLITALRYSTDSASFFTLSAGASPTTVTR